MKIDLEDEIWSRLYGPYGNRSVNVQLKNLFREWDISVAKELFWEELHHQDDVYPATYASLPWLVALSPSTDEAFEETYLFLSHVIHCACSVGGTGCDGTGPRGKYRGISTKIADHQHSWIPEREWLTAEDLLVLTKLEQWFTENHLTIAERCLSLATFDLMLSAYALEGFATANGSPRIAHSVQMFAYAEPVDFICEELGAFDNHDSSVVAKLYPHIHEASPKLASFLLDYPGCTFDPDDPRQGKMG